MMEYFFIKTSVIFAPIFSYEELNEEYIIPGAFDERVAKHVAERVAEAAVKCGVARV